VGEIFHDTILQGYNAKLVKEKKRAFIPYDFLINFQVDISGHPPFPAGSKQLSSNFDNLLFLAVFRVLNFQSRFEALNDVFWGMLRKNFHHEILCLR
jgi:hypothetical protein